MTRPSLVPALALAFVAATFGMACGTSRSAASAPRAEAARAEKGASAPTASALDEGDAAPKSAGEFQLQKSDSARQAHGERPSELRATRSESVMRLFVVDPDAGPIPGIVIKLTAPDGTRYFTGETDAEGYGEVLVPIGQKYELEYLSLGRRNISAHVDVPKKPNQNIRLTLRYRSSRGGTKAAAAKAQPPGQGDEQVQQQKKDEQPKQPEQRFVLDGVVFESAKATLKPESHSRLESVVEYMTHKPKVRIEVSGHTDSVGSARMNQALSEARAKAVRDYLVAQGIDPGRVDAVGFGDQRPVASNDTEAGRQQNRRIEVIELP